MKPKRTAGGSTVLSYEDVKPHRGLPAHVDVEWRDLLQQHLDTYLGSEGKIFHEIVSETVHLDLSVHSPTEERPFFTIATMGVSDAGLNVPEGAEEFRHIELLCYLPVGWDVDFANVTDSDESWWPGRLLKQLGRFAHEYRTFFAPGHTIPSPIGPYTAGSVLETALLVPPFLDVEEFHQFEARGKSCRFLAVWPITAAECQLKLERGTGDLLDMLEKAGVTPVIDPWRSCAVTRRKPGARAEAATTPSITLGERSESKVEVKVADTSAAVLGTDTSEKRMAAATKLLTGKRYKECIEAYRRVGADHPERWGDCLANMGAAYFFLGDFEKAIACYTQAIKHGVDVAMMQDNIDEARDAQSRR